MTNILHLATIEEINIAFCSDTSMFTATREPNTIVDELEYRDFNSSNFNSDGDYYNATAITSPCDCGKYKFDCTECFEIMQISVTLVDDVATIYNSEYIISLIIPVKL